MINTSQTFHTFNFQSTIREWHEQAIGGMSHVQKGCARQSVPAGSYAIREGFHAAVRVPLAASTWWLLLLKTLLSLWGRAETEETNMA